MAAHVVSRMNTLMERSGADDNRKSFAANFLCFFFQAEDGIRDGRVTGVQTCALPILARIRELNRLELAGETVRAALEALAAAAPGWLAQVIDASWQQVYGQRIDDIRLPESKARRAALAVQYGRDGYFLLRQVHAPAAPGWLAGLPAVQALRRIWIQQFYLEAGQGGEKVTWRGDEHGLPPGRALLVCPYDLDVRYAERRGTGWAGYKVHLSE